MSSTSIYTPDFTPTYLYIKQHSVTGKLYFGKCTTRHPEKYIGSGKYWLDHIKKHGKEHVETLWYCLFYDYTDIVEFSLGFSKSQNIGYGDTSIWANLMPENGLNGAGQGESHWTYGIPSTDHPNYGKTSKNKNKKGEWFWSEEDKELHKSRVKRGTDHPNHKNPRKAKQETKDKLSAIRKETTIVKDITTGKLLTVSRKDFSSSEIYVGMCHGTVSAFDLEKRIFCRVSKDEFYKFKNIKYVGHTSKLVTPTNSIFRDQ